MILFRGTGTALVTPFTRDGELDVPTLTRLVDRQIQGGVEAIVALGTTGENPTITDAERRTLVDTVVETAAGRVPVIVGTGSNDTAASCRYARWAQEQGAAGQLVVGPYYNRPTQAGFCAHVHAVADASGLPIVLYNVPGRTGFSFTAETTLTLARDVPAVVGVKEASGSLAAVSDILAGRPEGFAVYAGDDEMALPVALLGGDGVVSVIANALPSAFSDLVRLALQGHMAEARRAHFGLLDAMRACFAETNPIPVKAAMASAGLLEDVLRLPLLPLSDAPRVAVLDAFAPLFANERVPEPA